MCVVRCILVKAAAHWDPGAEAEQGLSSNGKPVWLNCRVEKARLQSRRQVRTEAMGVRESILKTLHYAKGGGPHPDATGSL